VNFEERLASFSSNGLRELRPAQLRALTAFESLRTTRSDIGIELPTGAGKTLIALLIADQALEEGRSVAYLTGTKQLAEQACEQAELLPGLDVELFYSRNYPAQSLRVYNQAEAVGIMNYWAYFNSQPRVEPADLLIFDDAHLAEQALAGLFTIRIPRGPRGATQLFREIADLVLQQAPDSYPSLQALRDGTAPWNTPPELISFLDWAAVSGAVEDAVGGSEYMQNSDLRFPWQAVRSRLRQCGVLVGPTAIEIRPYHVPSQTVAGYNRSRQRVYLSATLGQSGDLQRRLGVREVSTAAMTPAASQSDLGRRAFLVNPTQDATLSEASWAFAMQQAAAAANDGGGRVAWLCSSHSEADLVQAKLEEDEQSVVRLGSGEDPGLDRWRTSRNCHLVTAGRFDGLDFPDDVCRLVIIPSVPAASTEFERFVVAYLGDASYMRYRIGQRVTQAMGRANRTPNDSALYIGLDPSFGPVLADASVQEALGADVRATVNEALSYHGGTWEDVSHVASDFWNSHHRLPSQPSELGVTPARRNRPGRTSRSETRGESSEPEVNAVTRLWLGDGPGAADAARAAAEVLQSNGELEHAAFWNYVQAHSLYGSGRPSDIRAARAALEAAVSSAPQTAWFVRLRRTVDALAGTTVRASTNDSLFLAWDEWIREAGTRVQRRISRSRQMLEGTHDERCESLTVLARLCGASGERPEGQSAADARWQWTSPRKGQRRLWEVKTGGSMRVPREDINQILGQVQVEEGHNPLSRVVGCLLTSLTQIEPDAAEAARDKVVLVTLPASIALYDVMAELFTSYYSAFGGGSATERGTARHVVEARLPSGDWLADLLSPRGTAFIHRADVERLFIV
jgi:Type III restriction enzyme, res subunit/Helicase C-terminal domain